MKKITVEAVIPATSEKVWKCWTDPKCIMQWNHASPDWECPKATNDLRIGGAFHFTMCAKDGSVSFDFNGIYTEVTPLKSLAYTMEGGRTALVTFTPMENGVRIIETFEMEDIHSEERQRSGWQAILNEFAKHVALQGS